MKEPKGWGDVSLAKFAEVYDIIIDSSIEDFDKSVRIISILTDVSVNEIDDYSIEKFNELRVKYKWAYDVDFKPQPIDPIILKKYKIVFIKDIYNSKQFKASAYTTLMTLTQDKDKIHYNLDRIINELSVVYKRRFLFFWKVANFTTREKIEFINKHVSVDRTFSHAVFFCNYAENLTENIKRYLLMVANQKIKSAQKQIKKVSRNIGDGLR